MTDRDVGEDGIRMIWRSLRNLISGILAVPLILFVVHPPLLIKFVAYVAGQLFGADVREMVEGTLMAVLFTAVVAFIVYHAWAHGLLRCGLPHRRK